MKVFLVEDEYIVREGIKKNINWSGNGFTFCGEASDGELAFPLIKKEKPDIVITDICMPFMDGLELTKLVKQELPGTCVVILSGHEEFDYAKKAIGLGVEAYLLKPINGEELLSAVKKVALKIEAERQMQKRPFNDDSYSSENFENEKRKLFADLVNTNIALSEVVERSKKLNLELTAECYNVMLLMVRRGENIIAFSERVNSIDNELVNYAAERRGVIIFDRAPEGKAIVFTGDDSEKVQRKIDEFSKWFVGLEEITNSIKYFGAVGTFVGRLREIYQSYEAASHAFSYRFLSDRNAIISIEDVKKYSSTSSDEKEYALGNIDSKNLDRKKIEGFLRGGEIREIEYFVDEYLNNLGEDGINSLIFRQYMIMDMYFAANAFLSELDSEGKIKIEEPFKTQEDIQSKVSDSGALERYIVDIFSTVMEERDKQNQEQSMDAVAQAKQFIMDNYMDEELTLNQVASYVNVSPNHLSALFSQKMGQTFVKYLTDIRINRAKELLKCSQKKNNEISIEIGYKDPHYFSYLFKKNVGCSPTKYREGGGEE